MESSDRLNRPYPPSSNVIAVLQRIRDRNLPEVIDTEYFRDAGITESLVSRVVFAFKFLGLVEGDKPTDALVKISRSTDEEYRQILDGLIRSAYREVFEVLDPAMDPPDKFVNFFRRYTPASQRDRMVSFFLAICREAGIETIDAPRQRSILDPNAARQQKTRSAKPAKRAKAALQGEAAGAEPRHEGLAPYPKELEFLIRLLPRQGSPMPQDKRRAWLAMAETALAFLYTEESPSDSDRDEDSEE
jgi:hypothetical protein